MPSISSSSCLLVPSDARQQTVSTQECKEANTRQIFHSGEHVELQPEVEIEDEDSCQPSVESNSSWREAEVGTGILERFYPPPFFLALITLEPFFSHQDVTGETENDSKKKKDVARLLKTALGVELKEKLIGVWCS